MTPNSSAATKTSTTGHPPAAAATVTSTPPVLSTGFDYTGALAFDINYACWLDEHQRLINDLRSVVNSHIGDNDLCVLVDGVMFRYDEIFCLKGVGAKSDVFHMLSGMWKTPAERCFLWLGGFHSSELLKREKDEQMGESKVLMKAVLIVMTKRKHNHLAVLLLVLWTSMYAMYFFEAQ
ncbi:hypothetical protein RHSIM_Rhsim12G0194300 [Rhododendron simsii]|uniref:DOG1 domain-containing protein n=1 Tax=Rhododendron simsii TaxID=118357 RepID=A0A834L9K2_RHOSS|nr:hypothetical protein RHSIM_Rhsim12G0194300 [Rhododendron simsii]